MKKIFLLLLIAIFFSPTPAPWTDGYYPAIDLSTGCPNYAVTDADVNLRVSEEVLTLTANNKSRGGVYVGSIAGKVYEFSDDATYTLSGEFRKPLGSRPEQIDVNIQWVDENYIEHYAEIIWSLNPYSPLYGKVWTRNVSDQPIILYDLGDDNDWHSFSIQAYHNGDTHLIENITLDGIDILPEAIPEGALQKTYNNRLTVLLEVQNMYTNCDPSINTNGVSNFRSVNLEIMK